MAAAPALPVAVVPGSIDRFYQWSLLGMLASGYFALLGTGALDWPAAVLTFAALLVRALLVAGVVHFDPPPRAVAAFTLAYLGFFPLDFLYVSRNILSAIVHLILFLAVMKVVTARTPRDFGYLKIVAGLELLASAILSFRMSFFFFLALFLVATLATFTSGEIRASAAESTHFVRSSIRKFPRQLSVFTAITFLGILLLSIGTFFVLPRTARAAFQRFVPARYRLPGFANEITLGQIGEIKQNSRPVMHIRRYSGGSFENVRWRGSSLSQFDGKRWFNPPANDVWFRVEKGLMSLRNVTRAGTGHSVAYQVELNDIASDTLFFAGTPESISINVPMLRFNRYGTIRTPPRTFTSGLRYGVYSYLEEGFAPIVGPPDGMPGLPRDYFLQTPVLDPRVAELAREMAGDATNDFLKAKALERGLRTRYGYTLELLSDPVDDPLAHFLFVRKKGHCEYFASAMAVMLRTLNIPSRVATGFQGGVFNPMTGWQVVRASDAHSWVEAWIGDRWTTFDPTPSDPTGGPGALYSRMLLLMDAADLFWQDWVMGYNLDRQVTLASRMGESSRSFQFPKFGFGNAFGWLSAGSLKVLSVLMGTGAILIAAWMLFGQAILRFLRSKLLLRRALRGDGQPSDATLLYERLLGALSKRGIRKPAHMTPEEFAKGLADPGIRETVEELTQHYNQFRYGGRRDVAARMIQLLHHLEQSH